MKLKFSFVLSLVGIIFLVGFSVSLLYAHDPSLTNYPQLSHYHIKGKILKPDGSPARLPSGAVVSVKSSEVARFTSQECHVNQNEITSPINPDTGEYYILEWIHLNVVKMLIQDL